MPKLTTLAVISISIILVMALILGGCSSGTSTTSNTPTSNAPTSSVSPTTTKASTSSATQTTTSTKQPTSSSIAPTTTAASKEPIKIGVLAPLSGYLSAMGQYMTTGAQMVADMVNASGGLLGRQVILDIKDNLVDPSYVPLAATALQNDGVVAIVGSFPDYCDAALFPWAAANKVLIAADEDANLINRTNNFSKYLFFNAPLGSVMGTVVARNVAKQNDINSVFFLGSDVLIARDMHDYFWSEMNRLKPSVVDSGTIYVGPNETDFTTTINAILAKKPDLVFNVVAGPGFPAFVQQASAFNFFDKTKSALALAMGGANTIGFGKNFPEGLQAIVMTPYWLNTPEMQTFTKEFYSRMKSYPDDTTMFFYIATLALTQAIEKAGTTDIDKVINTWENMTLAGTPLGALTYNSYDHQANTPLWYGTTAISSEYGVAVATNMVEYQENIYPTKDEVLAIRAAK